MLLNIATPITALYDKIGYGCSVISLNAGTQEVDDTFGAFLLENYDGVTDPSVVVTPVSPADIEAQIAVLQAQLASLAPAPAPAVVETPAPVVPVAPVISPAPEDTPVDLTPVGVNEAGDPVSADGESLVGVPADPTPAN